MRYIVHENPVGRAESNYIAQADLTPFDLPPGTDMSPLFALLQREVDEAGAFWEWADAIPLSTTRS
jgi:hypothetical protein